MAAIKLSTVTFGEDQTYTLDGYGFLDQPHQWDEVFAEGMAEQQGIYGGLTEEHWSFINYLRDKFINEKTVPVVVLACSDNNLRLNDLRFLFPTGYHRGACRIAGINYNFMYETNYWLTYETTTLQKEEFKLTPDGFLEDFNKWNERFAQMVIREWKLSQGLTDRHREVIAYLRYYYSRAKNIPTVYETCKENNLELSEFRELFPEGYRRGACRLAGLPFFA
ncbi:TusE/DsrC/DsvC family sulfur relay protein [bacterium]|nr:TusE/DsrC/DsvC family sulfur relay protein [bacterium]MBU1650876.1 TusE/DsrC/DsvC family sulfur relay protein [bacterium]